MRSFINFLIFYYSKFFYKLKSKNDFVIAEFKFNSNQGAKNINPGLSKIC